MKKTIFAAVLVLTVSNAFALSDAEFAACPQSIKADVQRALTEVSSIEDSSNASSDLINALSFSVPGTVVSAPSCAALKGLGQRYVKIATELKKL